MSELVSGEQGDFNYSIDFEEGKFKVTVGFDGDQADGGLFINLGIIELLRIAAAKTDNTIDDAMVEMIAQALGIVPEEDPAP